MPACKNALPNLKTERSNSPYASIQLRLADIDRRNGDPSRLVYRPVIKLAMPRYKTSAAFQTSNEVTLD